MAIAGGDSIRTVHVKGRLSLAHMATVLREDFRREALQPVLWLPCALVSGIWCYFALAAEPSLQLILGCVVIAAFLLLLARKHPVAVLLATALIGFCLAKARADLMHTPMLRAFEAAVHVEGYVSQVSIYSKSQAQLIIDVIRISDIPDAEMPRRVRVIARTSPNPLRVGDKITATVDLVPLPRPEYPGGFDLARQLYFQSIGATGRARESVAIAQDDIPWRYRFSRSVHGIRSHIGSRIRAAISGPIGAFAEALVTGERATIPNSMTESLQGSGLFHVLSISGLHMTLVAGTVFWIVRAGLAAFPRAALQWPIKKFAAFAAMLMGFFYMVLADFGAATERSYIMIAVMFFAMLVDRPAISLHNLAIAAILILAFQPEEAVAAGFQMSFMAVVGLAAFYGWWSTRQEREFKLPHSLPARLVIKGLRGIAAALVTTLIAGSLSGIVASHHFGRIAPFGVVSNVLALPVISFVVMPMALIGTLLIPFGLEYYPFALLGQGLDVVMQISDAVASWRGANLALPALSAPLTAGLCLAAVLFCTSRTHLRWAALPVAAFALFGGPTLTQPDLLVESRLRNIAFRMPNGGLVPAVKSKGQYAFRNWARRAGDSATMKVASEKPGWTCDARTCSANVSGRTVAFLLRAGEADRMCPAADVVIAQYPLRRQCKGNMLTLDRFDIWRDGAHAIRFDGNHVEVAASRLKQGLRPWAYEARARRKNDFSALKSNIIP
jgi:competence protein ComEC